MQKYKELLMYITLVVLLISFLFQQIKPRIEGVIKIYNENKVQQTVLDGLNGQIQVAKAKVERAKKIKTGSDISKIIYTPSDLATDTESALALLLDDVIEMARKNAIKTHSVEYIYNPQDDAFIKGDPSKFIACQLNMKIVTDYSSFESFMQDLYKYNYLVNINKIEVYPYAKNKRVLFMNVTLTLYSYRNPNIPMAPAAPQEGGATGAEAKNQQNVSQPNAQPQTDGGNVIPVGGMP